MKISVEIEVPDDFEPGCCMNCPLNYTEWYDDDGWTDCINHCVLGDHYEQCPLEVKNVKVSSLE